MIVNNAREGWSIHRSTGRYLNKFPDHLYDGYDTLTSRLNRGTVEQTTQSRGLTDQFKTIYKGTRDISLDFLELMYLRMITHPDRVIIILGNEIIKVASLKTLVSKLEDLGHIEVFQGYSVRLGARPMVIQSALDNDILTNITLKLERLHNGS